MQKYPIGIQDFRKIREEGFLYIDKTELIHMLINSGVYYFLSRPRRFGKSLLLSTIKEIFSGSKELFEGLWIEHQWDWKQKNPVIHLKLSQIDYQKLGLYEALSREIDAIAGELQVSLKSENLKGKFRELIEKASSTGKVVLLVDEYDKPIIDYLNRMDKAKENRDVLKSFYSILKDADPHIRFLLLTGVSKFSKVSIFSDLNNLEDITLSEAMNNLLGISQQEIEKYFSGPLPELAKKFGLTIAELKGEIKEWYNGYSWSGPDTLYNPFSILSYFKNREFRNFWFETGTPTFLVNEIKKQHQFTLDEDEETSLLALGHFDIEQIYFKTILFQTGYLTLSYVNFREGWCKLRYPNKEVEASLQQFLLERLDQEC